MKTFEDYLAFIEDKLSIHLLTWQKDVLQAAYEHKQVYYVPAIGCGTKTLKNATTLLMALELLEETKKEKW